MLRSDEVECISLYFGEDGIKNVLERVGNAEIIHFIGNEKESDKINEIEHFEQKLNYLKKELEIHDMPIDYENSHSDGSLVEVEEDIIKFHEKCHFLKSLKKSNMKEEHILEQNLKMIKFSKQFIKELKPNEQETVIEFDFITAISDSDKKQMIKQMLKHRLRRNVYVKTYETELATCIKRQTLFVVYVIGEDNKNFARSIIKNLGARIYDFTTKDSIKHQEIKEKYNKIKRLNSNIDKQLIQTLEYVQKNFSKWKYYINKEQTINKAMKKLKKMENTKCYTGEGWVLKKSLDKLNKMKCFDNGKGRFMFEFKKTTEIQPTNFEPSEFSKSFQDLTNVFGVPKYRELNPAIFMIFTFPFLFGAMFGDVLHGLILLLVSGILILFRDKLDKKCGVFQIILEGRFVVLACSFFAVWFGLLYGDFGSLPVALFKSQYEVGRTYPFGIDPIWHHADNKMIFTNSLKMKLSLIIGFFHMGLGSVISIMNSLYFKDQIELMCHSIPQAIAFFLFLGYLVFLCVYKWLVTVTYPSIVNTLISMYTDPFNIKNQMYPGQMYVQLFIFSIILICIPWMIFSKPIYLTLRKKIPETGTLDLWITSGIHVVEFCLGLISNTSSYLRLWAVSLAHVQLTTVLHEFTMGNPSITVKILTLPIYIFGTLVLLIGLEGLSSCLHALRLNWIEFFSKFYSGGGILFEPLNFNIKNDED